MENVTQDVYDFIEEYRVVTFPMLAENFGFGKCGLSSSFTHEHVSIYGVSEELAKALQELITEGKIFEIACGIKLHDILLGGVRLEKYEHAHLNTRRYKYGYNGKTWLPVVFCSEQGVKEMRNVFLKSFFETNPDECDLITDVTDKFLSSDNVANRRKVSLYFSELFDGQASDIWNEIWDTHLTKEKNELN